MSIDRNDLATQSQEQQYGQVQSHWPIIINSSQLNLGVPTPVNMLPCDHIWLPVCYDPSIGLNPTQYVNSTSNPSATTPWVGPRDLAKNNAIVGINITDVFDMAAKAYITRAPIFSLQFNSPNAPWLLWGLGNMLSIDTDGSGGNGSLIGQGDCMRSITMPITRMWVKILDYGIIDGNSAPFDAGWIVLMSSLGVNHQTVGSNQPSYADSALATVPNWPQQAASIGMFSVSGGGYVTPQINTLERLELECKGLGSRREP